MVQDERAPATWSRVEDGFYVASRAGDFVGFIDRAGDDAFDVHDGAGRLIVRTTLLADAMSVLDPTLTVHSKGALR